MFKGSGKRGWFLCEIPLLDLEKNHHSSEAPLRKFVNVNEQVVKH